MSKTRNDDELRREYDLSTLKGGVKGKYYERAATGMNLVLLDADIAAVFPDADSVNRALRLLMDVAESGASSRKRRTSGSSRPRPRGGSASVKRTSSGRGG